MGSWKNNSVEDDSSGAPTGFGGLSCNRFPLCRREILGPRLPALSSTDTAKRNRVRIAGIWFRLWEWSAVHLLTDGLLHNGAAYFHEVALRA